MIGQNNNLNTIRQWRINRSIPRFIIISGEDGSGRLTLSKVIMKCLNATGIIAGNSINAVREIIENAYTITEPTFYIFRNADDMRQEAKNALLKVVEEPPNNAYFIMTVQNIDNMLGTIKSRGTVIKIEPYTQEQLESVCGDELILSYARNIADTKRTKEDIEQAEKCVNDVIQALQDRCGTRLLKACTQLKAKETDDTKIDCMLFMLVFKSKLLEYNDLISQSRIVCFVKCTQELQRITINKKASIECMLINILEDIKNAEIS